MGQEEDKKDSKKPATSGIKEHSELHGKWFVLGVDQQETKYEQTRSDLADYAGKYISKEMWELVRDGVETTFKKPGYPKDDASPGQMEEYRILLKDHLQDKKQYNKEKAQMFCIIIGQSSKLMRGKVDGGPGRFQGKRES